MNIIECSENYVWPFQLKNAIIFFTLFRNNEFLGVEVIFLIFILIIENRHSGTLKIAPQEEGNGLKRNIIHALIKMRDWLNLKI